MIWKNITGYDKLKRCHSKEDIRRTTEHKKQDSKKARSLGTNKTIQNFVYLVKMNSLLLNHVNKYP